MMPPRPNGRNSRSGCERSPISACVSAISRSTAAWSSSSASGIECVRVWHFVMGPIDHGMCQSIYATAPEGVMIEFSTSAAPIDADAWIDPEVVAYCGIDASDLARYRRPAAFVSRSGTVPQPDPHAKPNFAFPDDWKERGEALLHMTDEETAAALSVPTPPVPKKRAANG